MTKLSILAGRVYVESRHSLGSFRESGREYSRPLEVLERLVFDQAEHPRALRARHRVLLVRDRAQQDCRDLPRVSRPD